MKSIRYISHNENETKKLAVQIASKLNIGDIIVLTGELGSGKTKLGADQRYFPGGFNLSNT